jgi:hypothetical protein
VEKCRLGSMRSRDRNIVMREWLVIESSYKNCVFAPDGAYNSGYIPRDIVENELGIRVEPDGRNTWFTREDCERMRAHPEWRDTMPEWSPLGFWSV